jgi:hypothetical protein
VIRTNCLFLLKFLVFVFRANCRIRVLSRVRIPSTLVVVFVVGKRSKQVPHPTYPLLAFIVCVRRSASRWPGYYDFVALEGSFLSASPPLPPIKKENQNRAYRSFVFKKGRCVFFFFPRNCVCFSGLKDFFIACSVR